MPAQFRHVSYRRRSSKRNVSGNSFRKLLVERLDARVVFDCSGFYTLPGHPYLDSPPAEYLAPNITEEIARIAWEFDEWNKVPENSGRDFITRNCAAEVVDGHLKVAFVVGLQDASELSAQLESIHAKPVTNPLDDGIDSRMVAWVPLASLRELRSAVPNRGLALVNKQYSQTDTVASSSQERLAEEVIQEIDDIEKPILNSNWSLTLQNIWERYLDESKNDVDVKIDDPIYEIDENAVLVRAVSPDIPGTELASLLSSHGAKITAYSDVGVNARIPIALLPSIGNLPITIFATAETKPMTLTGTVDSQGDALMNTNVARNRINIGGIPLGGAGQTVGLLSDSFNRLGGAPNDVSTGNLPNVTVLAEGPLTGTDEGRAMLQIVHDVAPAANLMFATGNGGQFEFESNIQQLFDAGARIIVDDLLFVDAPMFMDGIAARRTDLVTQAGATYISSVGNSSNRSYETTGFVASGVTRDYGRGQIQLLDFDPGGGVDAFQQITVPANISPRITLQWQDPFVTHAPTSGGAQRDLDLLVYDTTGNTLVASSFTSVIGIDPVEVLMIPAASTERTLNVAIGGVNVAGLGRVKYVVTNNQVTINQFATNSPTSWGHKNSSSTIAVGAVNALVTPLQLQPYSSQGGTAILFNNQGQLLAQPTFRQTPDVVGPDNVNTTFFGTDSPNDTDSSPNFSGTSAVAPHIAGLAALLRQVRPDATSAQILNALTATAVDMGATGVDNLSGWGFVNGLTAAYAVALPQQPDLISASDSGSNQTDNITNITSPTFQGAVLAGSFVRLFVDGIQVSSQQLGTTTTNYSITVPTMAAGVRSVTISIAENSTSAQSTQSAPLFVTIDVSGPISFSGNIDLLSSADSGQSSADDITRLLPSLSVSGVIGGESVAIQLTRNGVTIGQFTTNNSTFTDNSVTAGSNAYQVRGVDLAGNVSSSGSSLNVVYDPVSPIVTIVPVAPDPRLSAINSVQINFSETIYDFNISDLTLRRDGGSNLLTSGQTVSGSGTAWSVSNLAGSTGSFGRYSLTVDNLGVSDLAGNTASTLGLIENWTTSDFHNYTWAVDVDNNGYISPSDALHVINVLNLPGGPGYLEGNQNLSIDPLRFVNTNKDIIVSASDALLVINYLNGFRGQNRIGGDAKGGPSVKVSAKFTDSNSLGLQQVALGQEFFIEGIVEAKGGGSIFSAYVDFLADSNIRLLGVERFDFLGSQTAELDGQIVRNLGSIVGVDSGGSGQTTFFRVRAVGTEPGRARVTLSPPSAGYLPTLLFGQDAQAPSTFEESSIVILPKRDWEGGGVLDLLSLDVTLNRKRRA